MLSKKSYKFLVQHFKVTAFLWALPFKWDSETGTVVCVTGRIKKGLCILNQVLSLVMNLWLYKAVIVGVMGRSRHVSFIVVDLMYMIVYTMQLFFQYEIWSKMEELAELFNHLLSFDQIYTKKYFPLEEIEREEYLLEAAEKEEADSRKKKKKKKPTKEKTDGCDDNIFSSLYMAFVYGVLSVSTYLKNPEDARYMYSGIPIQPEDKPGALYWFWAGMEYANLIRFCMTFNHVFYTIIIYAHTTNFWLHELSRPSGKAGNEHTIKKSMAWGEVIPNYRAFQVLNVHFNRCCSKIIIPAFKTLNISMHVLAIYTTISFHREIPLGGYLIFPIGTVMWFVIESDVYGMLGRVNELSGNYKDSWRDQMGKEQSRYFRSMFSLSVRVNIYYSIKKTTCLIVWALVLELVIDCIVL